MSEFIYKCFDICRWLLRPLKVCLIWTSLLTPASFHSDTTLQRVCIHLRGTTSISYLRTLEKETSLFPRSVGRSCQTCCKVGVVHSYIFFRRNWTSPLRCWHGYHLLRIARTVSSILTTVAKRCALAIFVSSKYNLQNIWWRNLSWNQSGSQWEPNHKSLLVSLWSFLHVSSRWCRDIESLLSREGFLQTVEIPPAADVVSIDLEPAAEY